MSDHASPASKKLSLADSALQLTNLHGFKLLARPDREDGKNKIPPLSNPAIQPDLTLPNTDKSAKMNGIESEDTDSVVIAAIPKKRRPSRLKNIIRKKSNVKSTASKNIKSIAAEKPLEDRLGRVDSTEDDGVEGSTGSEELPAPETDITGLLSVSEPATRTQTDDQLQTLGDGLEPGDGPQELPDHGGESAKSSDLDNGDNDNDNNTDKTNSVEQKKQNIKLEHASIKDENEGNTENEDDKNVGYESSQEGSNNLGSSQEDEKVHESSQDDNEENNINEDDNIEQESSEKDNAEHESNEDKNTENRSSQKNSDDEEQNNLQKDNSEKMQSQCSKDNVAQEENDEIAENVVNTDQRNSREDNTDETDVPETDVSNAEEATEDSDFEDSSVIYNSDADQRGIVEDDLHISEASTPEPAVDVEITNPNLLDHFGEKFEGPYDDSDYDENVKSERNSEPDIENNESQIDKDENGQHILPKVTFDGTIDQIVSKLTTKAVITERNEELQKADFAAYNWKPDVQFFQFGGASQSQQSVFSFGENGEGSRPPPPLVQKKRPLVNRPRSKSIQRLKKSEKSSI